MKKIFSLFFIVFLVIQHVCGQVVESKEITDTTILYTKPVISALARPTNQNKIMLRWIPDEALAWYQSNIHGYKIVRKTIERNGIVQANPDSVVINLDGIKIADKTTPKWLPYYVDDSVAFQTIFDASTETYANDDELNELYVTANNAANVRFLAAQFAGLGYIDLNVLPNEKYKYFIYSKVPKATLEVIPAEITVGLGSYLPYPKPLLPVINRDAKSIAKITLNADSLQNFYAGYYIERKVRSMAA
ncbi:MAG: hypothetical protein ACRCVT_11825, partial [Leadbetterella sp.]